MARRGDDEYAGDCAAVEGGWDSYDAGGTSETGAGGEGEAAGNDGKVK